MKNKSVFLRYTDIELDGSRQCMSYLSAYGMSDEVAQNLLEEDQWILELVFARERLIAARDWSGGESHDVPLPEGSDSICLEDVPQWPLFQLIKSRTSTGSHVGGKAPEDLILPEPDCIAPFQYLGTITRDLAGLEWLPFDLHLVGPVLNGYRHLILDYRDPMKPKLVNEKESGLDGFAFADDVITLDKVQHMRLGIRKINLASVATDNWCNDSSVEGHIGIPNWIQNAWLPVCPLSGREMSFICEFGFNVFVDFTSCSTMPLADFTGRLHVVFSSVSYGTLYVFLEPETSMVCIMFQMT